MTETLVHTVKGNWLINTSAHLHRISVQRKLRSLTNGLKLTDLAAITCLQILSTLPQAVVVNQVVNKNRQPRLVVVPLSLVTATGSCA